MNKKIIISLIFFIGIFVILSNLTYSKNIKASSEVAQELQKADKIKVAIQLNNGDKNIGISQQNDIINKIGKEKIKYVFSNVISAEITKEDLDKLENDGNVKSIEKTRVRNIFLQDIVPLANGTTSWAKQTNGVNLTGAGETVCIIDTGINYSHSDLGGCFGNECKVAGGYDFCADDVACNTQDSNPNDKHGHGTHVAGIIAANGSIKGVAPDAKIISIKVCNSAGSCSDDDIKAGFNWCIGNSTLYNISVISVSLGGGNYSGYCDGIDDPYDITSSINSAVGKNISVIVATGNDGLSTNISWPACIQNTTAVGSTTKLDAVSSFSNRNNITDLLAPGGTSGGTGSCSPGSMDANRICSTYYNGNYIAMSGTSMATPMVSGAFMLVKQFKRLENGKILTPSQIQSALNSTGKRITDASSGLNFARIDVYSAILSLDETPPYVAWISPTNTSYSYANMTINITSDSTNSSIWWFNGTANLSYSSSVSLNLSSGSYTFIAYANDSLNNVNSSSLTFRLNYSDVSLPIAYLKSPSDNSYLNYAEIYFSANFTDNINLLNSTLFIWNSSGVIINSTTRSIFGTANVSNISVTLPYQGSFTWNYLVFDNSSNSGLYGTNFSLVYDATAPYVGFVSPLNNTQYNNSIITINITNNSDASYIWWNNGTANITYSSPVSLNLADGNYNFSAWANDSAGNVNRSIVSISVNDTTAPYVGFVSPTNTTYVVNLTTINILSDSTNSSIWWFNGTANLSYSQVVYLNLSSGSYTFIAYANDSKNNINFTPIILTVRVPYCGDGTCNSDESCSSCATDCGACPTSGSGGGGGGGSSSTTTKTTQSTTYTPSNVEISQGYIQLIDSNSVIKFGIENQNHTIKSEIINSLSAKITVESTPQIAYLNIGEEKNFSIDATNILIVKLLSIENNKSKISVRRTEKTIEIKNETIGNNITSTGTKNNNSGQLEKYIIVGIVVFALLLALIIIMIKIMGKKLKNKDKDAKWIIRERENRF